MSDQEMKTFLLLAGWYCLAGEYWIAPDQLLQSGEGFSIENAYQKQINAAVV